MPSFHKKLRDKIKAPTIYGASDQKVTRFFIFNRAWIANERIVGLTALLVVGLGVISYAAFAASLNAPAGNIDDPANGAEAYQNVYTIDGWAVAGSAINHVEIYIDGIDQGTASYGTGGARPDVCSPSLYASAPDCINRAQHVGWQFNINPYSYALGPHTVVASIYSNAGGHTDTAPKSFYTDYYHLPPTGSIDTPTAGATVSGVINVGGWALDGASRPETPINRVIVSVDGSLITAGTAAYGASRPDVCAAYPSRPGCENNSGVGWNYSLNTTLLSNGPHTIYVTAYDSDATPNYASLSQAINVSNANPTAPPIQTPPGPGGPGGGGGSTTGGNGFLDGFIDDPKPASKTPPNPYSGSVTFDGWAIGYKTVSSSVKLYIDGKYIGAPARYGQGGARTDVCNNHVGWLNCPAGNVGWQVVYDTTKLANGTHNIYALIDDGAFPSHAYTTPTVTFSTKNSAPTAPPVTTPTPPPPGGSNGVSPDGYVDSPKAGATVGSAVAGYIGYVSINGWAIDAQTKIAKVDIYLDGKFLVTAPWGGGGGRQDICAGHVGWVGCPTAQTSGLVGFQVVSYTSNLANGSHKIHASIYDSDSAQHRFDTSDITFNVNNTSSAPPANTNLQPDLIIDGINDPGTTATSASGWAIDNMTKAESAITKVTATVDTTLIGNATYGTARPDVCASAEYPGRPGCPNVGWTILFDTSNLADGTHTLYMTATDATGQTRTVGQTFLIANGGNGSGGGGGGGGGRSTTDRNPDSTAFHVLYVVPNDQKNGQLVYDNHRDTNGSIQGSISAIQSWLKGQSNGHTFNIDKIPGTSRADITFVQLKSPSFATQRTEAYYEGRGASLVVSLRSDISTAMKDYNSHKKYLVYFEGGSNYVCSITASSNDFSLITLMGAQQAQKGAGQHDCKDLITFDRSSSNALRTDKLTAHEMMHALGAVTGSGCADIVNVHVTDSNDLMYNGSVAPDAQLDVGKISYWGSTPNCTNVITAGNGKFIN